MSEPWDKSRFPILIVDDEPEIAATLTAYLGDYPVECAGNADEALKKLYTGQFKIVLIDIVMPGMDGLELLRQIKKMNPVVQVIILTGQTTLLRATEAMQNGALRYLLKPLDDIEEVNDAIEEAIDKTRAWDDVYYRTIMVKNV